MFNKITLATGGRWLGGQQECGGEVREWPVAPIWARADGSIAGTLLAPLFSKNVLWGRGSRNAAVHWRASNILPPSLGNDRRAME